METASSFGKLCSSMRRKRLERTRGKGRKGVGESGHVVFPTSLAPFFPQRKWGKQEGRAPRLFAFPSSRIMQFIPPLLFVICKS